MIFIPTLHYSSKLSIHKQTKRNPFSLEQPQIFSVKQLRRHTTVLPQINYDVKLMKMMTRIPIILLQLDTISTPLNVIFTFLNGFGWIFLNTIS